MYFGMGFGTGARASHSVCFLQTFIKVALFVGSNLESLFWPTSSAASKEKCIKNKTLNKNLFFLLIVHEMDKIHVYLILWLSIYFILLCIVILTKKE